MKTEILVESHFAFFGRSLRFIYLAAVMLCFSVVAATAQEEVIWQQSHGTGAGGVKDFGPSQKAGSAEYNVNSELADDINLVGTINRIEVHGNANGPFLPDLSSSHYFGLNVRFYALDANNKPGALQAEYFIPKNSPNFLYQDVGLGDLRVRLETPFQATGRHFISVQVVIDPVIIPGSGGSTQKWYWRSDNAEPIREEAPYFRENPGAPWGRDEDNDGSQNLSLRLWGTRILTTPTISQISTNTLSQAGRLKITGTNFGNTQGASTVRINGATAPISNWSETSITAYVPDTSIVGAGSVEVITEAGTSNSQSFTITTRTPANGRVKWRFEVDAGTIHGRPAVASDGTVYAVDSRGHLYAVSPEGGIKWIFTRDTIARQGVSVGTDGTIYYAAGNELYAVNPNGTLKWNVVNTNGGGVAAGPNVGTDGNIYAVFANTETSGLSAIVVSPAGNVLDNDPAYFEGEGGGSFGVREIVFGLPGQYYFVLNNLDISRSGFNFFALGGNHLFSRGQFYGQPAVAPDGTIYAINAQVSKVSAIDPTSGSVIRNLPNGNAAPDVGSDGNVYATEGAKVFSFNPAGEARWDFQSFGILGKPVVSPNNDVVASNTYEYAKPGVVQGINAANGSLVWEVNFPAENGGYVRGASRPRFSANGETVYYGTNVNDYANDVYSYLYSIATSTTLPCSFVISPNNAAYPYNGGSGNINVSAISTNCSWTATSSVNWITVHNTGGNGNSTVTYTVTANPEFVPRTGILTVAGQTFTITQAARTTATNVSITYPISGQEFTLPDNLFISANASNAVGDTARVEFYANSVLIGTDISAPYQIVWNNPSAANYTLIAKSIDGNGAATLSEAVMITVNPVPPPEPAPLPIPPPTLTSPTVNQEFLAGDNVTFSAFPGASQYSVEEVEFYLGTTLIGSDNTSPYSFTLNNVPAGIYSVSARTIADTGARSTSQPKDIIVNPERISSGAKLFDFDGDGKSDISVFRPSNGVWYLQQSTNGFNGTTFGLETDKIVPADYDGDGKTDVAVYRGGTWYLQRSRLGFTGIAFGDSNDVPVPADYDGDGKADVAVFRPSNGTWYLQRSQLGFTGIQFGQAGDKPVAADYDGDGKADIAVFRNGIWYLQRSTLGFTGIAFGEATDKPVPADYDGDGKTDIAVFRPSNGTWYLQRSTAGFTGIQFGLGTDKPTPADYDGDGKADIAVFRDGTWYLQRSQQGFTGVAFGAATDIPVPFSSISE